MTTEKELSPRAQAKRNQILDAAQELFLTKGFSGTSMDLVTMQAGVSKQTTYKYFPSKEILFSEVMKNLVSLQEFEFMFTQIKNASISTNEELQTILVKVAERLTKGLLNKTYLAVVRTAIAELQQFPQLGELFKKAVPDRALHEISSLLERAHEKGIVQIPNSLLAAHFFLGPLIIRVLLDGLLMTKSPTDTASSVNHEEHVQTFMRAFK